MFLHILELIIIIAFCVFIYILIDENHKLKHDIQILRIEKELKTMNGDGSKEVNKELTKEEVE